MSDSREPVRLFSPLFRTEEVLAEIRAIPAIRVARVVEI